MLWVPTAELRLVADSQSGVRPAAAYGTSVTPGNNAYSSYVSLLSATSEDSDWIEININSIATTATASDTLVTIGVDPAGGSSYSDFIPHLICSAASPYISAGSLMGGAWYRFPVRVRSGSTLAVKATQNNASPIAASVLVRLYRQSRLDVGPRIGSYIKTFGETTATSTGTAITPGTTSDGAWTQLGSAVGADDNLFFWQLGLGVNNSAMNNCAHHIDLGIGDGTNYRTPILDQPVLMTNAEQLSAMYGGACAEVANGDKIFARAQTSTTVLTGISAIAYGVGG